MNTAQIKSYAPQARKDFIAAVTYKANSIGISEKEILAPEIKGDIAIIGGLAFPKAIIPSRKLLIESIGRKGFGQVMEEAAYTWFNRFVALRYMELHHYLDHGFRVFSNPSGSGVPEILEQAANVDLPGLNKEKVIELRLAGDKDNELFRMLLIAQCNALHEAMPFLFERINQPDELLLPDNLLHTNSPIRKMVEDIDESAWEQVEIIGWIYQFYISEKKDQVIGKVVKSEDIPAATQLFTPNWIVKYMVQNSLGRKWLDTYPDSPLRDKMEYYIKPAEQEPEVQAQLSAITPRELNPEEITFMDPACGSGHILVEAYNIYKEIYLERGYRSRDIPKLILEKNLHGLDICDRAVQLARFALLMRARQDDRRILADRKPELNVLAIQESRGLDAEKLAKTLTEDKGVPLIGDYDMFPETRQQMPLVMKRRPGFTQAHVVNLLELFKDAKTFGSLIRVPQELGESLGKISDEVDGIIAKKDIFAKPAAEQIKPFIRLAGMLAAKYDVVVTNPPYMGAAYYDSKLKIYINNNFKNEKGDLYTCFIKRNIEISNENGWTSMITIPNWMFLSSFKELRDFLLDNTCIDSLVHNGRGVWGSDFGSCSFVIRKLKISYFKGVYKRLFEKQGSVAGNDELKERFFSISSYNASSFDLKKIPGSPIAYWVSERTRDIFQENKSLSLIATPRAGLATGDNPRYQMSWSEVSLNNIIFDCESNIQSIKAKQKWYPCNSGGQYRKWYGNNEIVVNWQFDGEELRNFRAPNGKLRSRPQNTQYYFREGITWTKLSSSLFGARFREKGFIFDDTGRSAFPEKATLNKPILSILCSKLSSYFLSILNPSMSFTSGDVGNLPIPDKFEDIFVENILNKTVEYAKKDWDTFETSWNFTISPLIHSDYHQSKLITTYNKIRDHWHETTLHMQHFEEENNRIFIEAYGLQDELNPEVPLNEITLTCNPHYRYGANKTEEELETLLQADTIKELVSYSIGCMMGRYSLDEPGLIYANSGNVGFDSSKYKSFPADDDGIIPIMDAVWFDDDAANRFVEFIKVAFSPETLDENLKFVAESLGARNSQLPTDTIRQYLSKSFFKDHLKTYKNRPIYWLFSSGKQKAFECLVYLHRYNESTLSRLRSSYVTPLQGKFNGRMEFLKNEIANAANASAQKNAQKELDTIKKKQLELAKFDEELRHYADKRISLDLDDGVKVNYGKFGNLLAETKAVTKEDGAA